MTNPSIAFMSVDFSRYSGYSVFARFLFLKGGILCMKTGEDRISNKAVSI